jgi:hypothetical protein
MSPETAMLRELATARSGEKGDLVLLAAVAYDLADWHVLRNALPLEVVRDVYAPILTGSVRRFELPLIGALNFVLEGALGGGRTRNLAFDESGKALASRILALEVPVPAGFVGRSRRVAAG